VEEAAADTLAALAHSILKPAFKPNRVCHFKGPRFFRALTKLEHPQRSLSPAPATGALDPIVDRPGDEPALPDLGWTELVRSGATAVVPDPMLSGISGRVSRRPWARQIQAAARAFHADRKTPLGDEADSRREEPYLPRRGSGQVRSVGQRPRSTARDLRRATPTDSSTTPMHRFIRHFRVKAHHKQMKEKGHGNHADCWQQSSQHAMQGHVSDPSPAATPATSAGHQSLTPMPGAG
jgi:hypothetical protein